MNIKLLKSKMVLAGDTQRQLADYLSLSQMAMSHKMTGKVQFKVEEIGKIAWKYNLTAQETYEIFLGKGVESIEESNCS